MGIITLRLRRPAIKADERRCLRRGGGGWRMADALVTL